MPFEKGDFVLINYIAKVKETGEIFDTTLEDLAKKERLYKEGEIYEPQLVVIGEGWVLKALDENLPNLELDKPGHVEIPPEKAFGIRDPEKVRLVPLRRLTGKGVTPQLGMRFEFEGKLAIVRTIGAGRVQLDFNPPLAGKTLVYEVTAQKKLETEEEKLNALIHRRIPAADVTKFVARIENSTVEIEVPEESFYIEGLQAAKRGIAIDLQRFFTETETVRFIEAFKRKGITPQKTGPEESASQETSAEESASQETSAEESAEAT